METSTEKKKRIISQRDTFDAEKTFQDAKSTEVKIGTWNPKLHEVLEKADLCCIPVYIMHGVGNCGKHYQMLQSTGFQNWQMSCSIFLSYETAEWGAGSTESWLDSYTNQYTQRREYNEKTGIYTTTYWKSCPDIGVHWKKQDGKVLNVGKTTRKDYKSTGLGIEPYKIEEILSDYYADFEEIDLFKCIVDVDRSVNFQSSVTNSYSNSSKYKTDYNLGCIYKNLDNSIYYSQNVRNVPLVCFYQNYSKSGVVFFSTRYFKKLLNDSAKNGGIDYWKNNYANILWCYVVSDEQYNSYNKARVGSDWQKWIGDLENHPEWNDQLFLIKVYDPDRGINRSFSFDQLSSIITKDENEAYNFISFFQNQLSDFYNGVTKKEYYKVTFQDYNGATIKVVEGIEYGNSPTPPESPSRSGYTFSGWYPPYTNVTSDITCVAQYGKQEDSPENEEIVHKNTIRAINCGLFGKESTKFRYSDEKTHSLKMSNNIVGEILASKNDNGLKRQISEINRFGNALVELSSNCFDGCVKIKSVDMRNTNVVKIGDECFYGCTNLENVNFSEKLESIGDGVFGKCEKLKSVSIPFSDINDIPQKLLVESSIEDIYLPNILSTQLKAYCSE